MNKRYLIFFLFIFVCSLLFSMPPRITADDMQRGEYLIPERSFSEGELIKREFTGTFKAVVLFVDFPDKNNRAELSFFNDLLNSEGLDFKTKYPVSTNVSSVREYYQFESNNTFHLSFDVFGWFDMPQDYDYYVGSGKGLGSYPNNSQKLVEDAIAAADGVVDFSDYDNDNDGEVDFLLVVHAGTGAEFEGGTSDIWSHQWTIGTQYRDGVALRRYSMQPEYWLQTNDMTIGVYCHELGHLIFGLPDLYDTTGNSYGIGYWGLMGGGSWNDEMSKFGDNEESGYGGAPAEFTAWSKLRIGWYDPITFDETRTDNVEMQSRGIYKCVNSQNGNQYFLYEFKESNKYNDHLPGENGVMIYRCDDQKYGNSQPWTPGTSKSYHYMVEIIQKDNLWSLENKTNRGDSTDLFFAGDQFNQYTEPENFFYDDNLGIAINHILISQEMATLVIGDLDFGIYLQELSGLNKIRCYIKKTGSELPVIRDELGNPLAVKMVAGYDAIYYLDILNSASDTVFISDIPLNALNW
ncbi:MAG TPA: M6 family metalloprotease domain-containing protein [Thermotogota bacterium]|nr:M6 family metalloprotease domain-containing protein [Thermotogota bacterium]HPR94690.1 M6 family metalloprotease domain-containing protein [Thermotogota bacterium]